MSDQPEVQPGEYKHYKGGEYIALFNAKHSETMEDMVVYQNIKHGSRWCRPVSEWNKPIDGQPGVQRFAMHEGKHTLTQDEFNARMERLRDEEPVFHAFVSAMVNCYSEREIRDALHPEQDPYQSRPELGRHGKPKCQQCLHPWHDGICKCGQSGPEEEQKARDWFAKHDNLDIDV